MEKQKIEEMNIDYILQKTKDVKDTDAVVKELRKIMDQFNIKHSLRGDE